MADTTIDPRKVKWDDSPSIDASAVKWDDGKSSGLDKAARVAGLVGRTGVQAVLGLPVLVGEGLNQGYNLAARGINAMAGTNIEPRQSVLEGFNTFLTNAGLPEPSTPAERMGVAVGSALGGAGVQNVAAGMSRNVAGSTADLVRNTLMQQPARQGVAAATGATAAQGVAEAGGGPAAQMAAGVAGGFAPFAGQTVRPISPNRIPEIELIRQAREAGYVIPPSQMGGGMVANAMEGLGGKEALGQQFSVKNQAVTDTLARKVLGVSEDTALTPQLLETKRKAAGMVYDEIKDSGLLGTKNINIDYQYKQGVNNLGGAGYRALKMSFPGLAKGDIENLQQSLQTISPTTEGAIEAIKELRFKASQNYRAVDSSGNPSQRGLAQAQKDAATLLEDLIERNLQRSGRPDLVPRYRQARKDIAVTHSIEDAMDARGHVIAKDLDPRDPLSPELKLASDFSRSFSKANQNINKMPSPTQFTKLDALHAGLWGFGGSHIEPTTGWGMAAIPLVAQPAMRGALGTELGQFISSPPTSIISRPEAALLGILSGARGQQ